MPPAVAREPDIPARERHALRLQELTLGRFVPSIAAETATGCNYAVARNIRPSAVAHDVAHRPSRARPAGKLGDVAVSRDLAAGNSTHDSEHLRRELCIVALHCYRAAVDGVAGVAVNADGRAFPCACGRLMPTIDASVGATSAGEAASL